MSLFGYSFSIVYLKSFLCVHAPGLEGEVFAWES